MIYNIPFTTTSTPYIPPTSTASTFTYSDLKNWLKTTESTGYPIKTPYDSVYAHQNLKGVDVLKYIIESNWDMIWDYTDARVPTSNNYYANTTCTSSNGTLPRRRR